MRHSRGPPRRASAKSSQLIRMPAARATATQCMVWLVEPPVANKATSALTRDFLSPARTVACTGSTEQSVDRFALWHVLSRQTAAGHWEAQRRPRQMQAHHFKQHLIAVRCPIKGAVPRTVVGLGFALQQLPRGRLCLLHSVDRMRAFSLLGNPEGIRAGRHK